MAQSVKLVVVRPHRPNGEVPKLRDVRLAKVVPGKINIVGKNRVGRFCKMVNREVKFREAGDQAVPRRPEVVGNAHVHAGLTLPPLPTR